MGTKDGSPSSPHGGRGGAAGGPSQCRLTRAKRPRKEGCSFKLTSFRDIKEHEDWENH